MDLKPRAAFEASPRDFFQEGMRRIASERMQGLPIVNPRIEVHAVDFRRWGNDWIGVMVTPWSIAAVYVCGVAQSWIDVPAGKVRLIELPAGDFPFISVEDPILGQFLSLPLKSPVLDMADQETADEFARVALKTMLTASSIPEDDEDASAWAPPAADGQLRRVIPIKVAPPKNYLETPALTPKPAAPEKSDKSGKDESEKFSRRDFFGRGRRWVEKKAAAPEKHRLEAAAAGESEAPAASCAPSALTSSHLPEVPVPGANTAEGCPDHARASDNAPEAS